MEQSGEGKTQRFYRRVDKLLPVCGHEEPDGGHGRMAPPKNPGNVLEAMKEGTHQI